MTCPVFCDYDCCLNRGGGTLLRHLGRPRPVAKEKKYSPVRRALYHVRRRLAAHVKKVVLAREANTIEA